MPIITTSHLVGNMPRGCFIRVILVCMDDDSVILKTCARHIEENKKSMFLAIFYSDYSYICSNVCSDEMIFFVQ